MVGGVVCAFDDLLVDLEGGKSYHETNDIARLGILIFFPVDEEELLSEVDTAKLIVRSSHGSVTVALLADWLTHHLLAAAEAHTNSTTVTRRERLVLHTDQRLASRILVGLSCHSNDLSFPEPLSLSCEDIGSSSMLAGLATLGEHVLCEGILYTICGAKRMAFIADPSVARRGFCGMEVHGLGVLFGTDVDALVLVLDAEKLSKH